MTTLTRLMLVNVVHGDADENGRENGKYTFADDDEEEYDIKIALATLACVTRVMKVTTVIDGQ